MADTHFGFKTVDEREKASRVRSVFDSVAPKYDVMNDLMSAGLHRLWKRYTLTVANPQPGQQVLDIAGGTGDLSLAFAKKVGPTGRVVHTDINEAMLREGRTRLLDLGVVLPTLVCDAVWKQISYNFLFFLAGLQSIPKSLIEAAAIDGAGPWRRFWSIVFPLLSPTTFFLLVINIVYAFFDTFGIVDATTQGGPGKDTAILVYKVYYDGFKALDMGGSAAQSVVLMVVVITLTVIQFRFVEKKVQY